MSAFQAIAPSARVLWRFSKRIFAASLVYGAGSGLLSYSENKTPEISALMAVMQVDSAVTWSTNTFFRNAPIDNTSTAVQVVRWGVFPVVGIFSVGAGGAAYAADGAARSVESLYAWANNGRLQTPRR